MDSHLRGRIRNLNLPPKRCLLPIIEAVTNSLQAVDDREKQDEAMRQSWIKIRLIRDHSQADLFQHGGVRPLVSIEIEDNGIGFDDQHFTAFNRLDDDFRLSIGGKGIGRLSWLSAFSRVEVASIFQDTTKAWRKRSFVYSIEGDGVQGGDAETADTASDSSTTIRLVGIRPNFRDEWPKKPFTFVDRIVASLQRNLALETCPNIEIFDSELPETIELRAYFRDTFVVDRREDTIDVSGERFTVSHLLHRISGESIDQKHTITFLANGRPAEDPHAIPAGLGIPKGAIRDEASSLYYSAFVAADLLDASTNDSRTHVDIASESNALPDELTRETIVKAVAREGREFLKNRLVAMHDELRLRIERICNREVRFRPLLTHCKVELAMIEPSLPDSRLEDAINGIYREHMQQLRDRTRLLSKRAAKHIDDLASYQKEVQAVLEGWNEASMSDLAAYVAHRRVILWFLKARLEFRDEANYHFEETVHAIFFPMGFDTDGFPVQAANLWLIDERLSFHEYLASDMAIRRHKLLKNKASAEPDVTVYQVAHAFGEQSIPRCSITLVEFKRPGRDDYTMDDNPYTQSVSYIEDIRDGSAKFRDGRPINDLRSVHFFVYIVADHSKTLNKVLKAYQFHETSDGRGYYLHGDRAYFEVITYDKLIDDAALRHKGFFDLLNLPEDAGGGMTAE